MKKAVLVSLTILLMFGGSVFGQAAKAGRKAPDFTLPDLEGNEVTLSKVIGHGPVYVNFWATWCSPCKKEIPELIELYNKYKDRGFKVLCISVDNSRSVGKVKSFVKDRKMNFTVLLDSKREVYQQKYKGHGIPYGFLLDNEGKVIYPNRGYIPGIGKLLEKKMQKYLLPAKSDSTTQEQAKEKPESKIKTPEKEETKK